MVSCFAYTTFLAWFVDEASGAADYSEDTQRTPERVKSKQISCSGLVLFSHDRRQLAHTENETYRDSSKSNLYCDYTSTL